MASKYKRFLAEKVLNDQEHVTYRALSRALEVHCNHAKRMLYEFHRHENSKKPNSVNATYLLTGVLETSEYIQGLSQNGKENEIPQSSPFVSSQVVPEDEPVVVEIPVTSVILVDENDLQDAKSNFSTIYSIFVYSVQPASPPDMTYVADITALISTKDPLQYGHMYGMIQNENVKRRTGGPPAAVLPSKPVPAKPVAAKPASLQPEKKPQPQKVEPESVIKAESESRPLSRQSSESQNSAKNLPRPSSAKRSGSDLFKAFAKSKPKVKQEETAAGSGVDSGEPSGNDDVVMGDDDSEEEREDLFLDTGKRVSNKSGETRKQREERLRKMMDDDDDEMPDAPKEEPDDETPVADESATTEPQEQETSSKEAAPPEMVTTSGGRRRGKRRVVKKKRVKDEHGYLVTKEETVWESFSEDEQVPSKKQPPVSSTGKQMKGAPKTGQGNLMAFFGKK